MRRWFTFLAVISALLASAFTTLGVGPRQEDVPPRPFFPDFISGTISVQGSPAPAGAQLVACIDDCATVFKSQPVQVEPGGVYSLLEVNPTDERVIGHTLSFYLVSEFGRIEATEKRNYQGDFGLCQGQIGVCYTADLTFEDPLPAPTPTPTMPPTPTITPTASLPVAGDPAVTAIPRLALIVGTVAVAAGITLLLLARRRARY